MNGGDTAVLHCFVFLYIIFAGPGPWSVDVARTADSDPVRFAASLSSGPSALYFEKESQRPR
jgi:hypothetical protein